MNAGDAFDYEAATWGGDTVAAGERSIAGYRLREALVHLPDHGRVLEVGCGGGRFLRALRRARPALELTGADVSHKALALLAERASEIEARRIDGADLPAADGEFDAVLVIDVLEHVKDPQHMLAEAWRALAPGGLLHLHVPCEGDPRSLWRWLPGQGGERALKRRFGGHIQRFRRDEILSRLLGQGFELLRVRNSLHVIGNLSDVAMFVGLAFANREKSDLPAMTTGDVMAQRSAPLRLADALIYWEARLLARVPSWSIHVSARKTAEAGRPITTSA